MNNTTQAARNTTQGTTQATQGTTQAAQGTTQTNECVGVSEERYGNVPRNVPQDVPQDVSQDVSQDVPQYQLDEQILEALQKDNKISTKKLAIMLGSSSKTIKHHIKKMDNIS